MVNARTCGRLIFVAYVLSFLRSDAFLVDITYVQNAVAKGAVCLDGSPPAYHLDRGSGLGINNWLVHIEGGGWCNNVTNCLSRKTTRLGSSKKMATQLAFFGILSNSQQFNPDFYNWNRVKIRYCDGSSFTGDVEAVNKKLRNLMQSTLSAPVGSEKNALSTKPVIQTETTHLPQGVGSTTGLSRKNGKAVQINDGRRSLSEGQSDPHSVNTAPTSEWFEKR